MALDLYLRIKKTELENSTDVYDYEVVLWQ